MFPNLSEDYRNLIASDETAKQAISTLKLLRADARLLGMNDGLVTLIKRTISDYEKRIGSGEYIFLSEMREVLDAIQFQYNGQCERKKLFRLSDAESSMFDNQHLFGIDVTTAFSSAATLREIREAGSCIAMGRYTACVFHLMRVLERGLRAFAVKVGAGMASDFETENWHNVIDRIESKIKELQSARRSDEKLQGLKDYSEVATQFRYFKDAWRNHVAHGRQSFEYDDAFKIFQHVKEFMQHLAKIGIREMIEQ